MNPPNETDGYRPLKPLTLALTLLLGGSAFACIVYFIAGFCVLLFPAALTEMSDGSTESVFLFPIGFAGILESLLFIATIIVFLIWMYRAYKNLSGLRAYGLLHSPGWAVGWWFIPFANLIKPFTIMREIWVNSDPDYEEEFGFLSSQVGAPAIVGLWWGMYIASGFISRIGDAFNSNANGIQPSVILFLLIYAALRFGAAIFAIQVVRGITDRQEKRFERILNAGFGNAMPPEPPTFYHGS